MTNQQYREALEHWGITQAKAAEAFGITVRTSNGYANILPIPHSFALLIKLMLAAGLKPQDFLDDEEAA